MHFSAFIKKVIVYIKKRIQVNMIIGSYNKCKRNSLYTVHRLTSVETGAITKLPSIALHIPSPVKNNDITITSFNTIPHLIPPP